MNLHPIIVMMRIRGGNIFLDQERGRNKTCFSGGLRKSKGNHYRFFVGMIKGTLRQGSIPAKPRFRSVPDVTVLSAQPERAVC